MNTILLDTNAYTSLLSEKYGVVFDAVTQAEIVYMSVVVLAELLSGFKGGGREKENIKKLRSFLEKSTVKIINATAATAEIFATVKQQLTVRGNPIPINNIWIAAHTIEAGAYLITFDNHFKKVPGLLLWDY